MGNENCYLNGSWFSMRKIIAFCSWTTYGTKNPASLFTSGSESIKWVSHSSFSSVKLLYCWKLEENRNIFQEGKISKQVRVFQPICSGCWSLFCCLVLQSQITLSSHTVHEIPEVKPSKDGKLSWVCLAHRGHLAWPQASVQGAALYPGSYSSQVILQPLLELKKNLMKSVTNFWQAMDFWFSNSPNPDQDTLAVAVAHLPLAYNHFVSLPHNTLITSRSF